MLLENREVKKEMVDFLPQYYHESKVIKNLMSVEGVELESFNKEAKFVLDQFFIETATEGLDMWEWAFDIKPAPSQTIEERRSVLKARLRGVGTVTAELIKTVCESYIKGTVEVIENNSEYQIIIKFIEDTGIPTNIDLIQKSVREVIPAHLAILYKYNYLVWDDLELKTWNDIESANLTFDEFEIWE